MRFFVSSLVLVVGLFAFTGCAPEDNIFGDVADSSVEIDPATLPSAVQTYISTNYPNQGIYEAERYDDCEVYEVELANGIELYFDLQGNFLGTDDTFDCDEDTLNSDDDYVDPDSLPASVLSYIATNFPNDSIYEVERDEECETEVFEVELNSGIELYFDLQGNFLGTDETFDCDDDDSYNDDDDYVDPDSLPASALSYIATNFPNDSIYEVERDNECDTEVYEVELSSGIELYFDLQGNFLGTDETFDCDDDDEIDPSTLPANLLSYISANYPNDSIYEAERDDECDEEVIKVELTSGIELYFDLQGNFLGTDDTFDCDDNDD